MKPSSKRTPVSVRDFRYLFSVRSILFHRQRPFPLRIYLEKDVQIIGVITQLVPPLAAGLNRCFSEFTPPIQFRMAGDRISSYSVSLYEELEGGSEQHLETAELKFSKFLEQYCRQFHQLEEEMSSELREKQPGSFAKIWKTLSQRFTKKVYTSAVRFEQAQGILEFDFEPIHYYDEVAREADQAEQRRRERRERHEENYKKTHTISDTLQVEKEPLHRAHTDSDLTLMDAVPFQSKKILSPSKKDSLKENKKPRELVLKAKEEPLSNIPQVSDSYQSLANSNKTNQILGESKKHKKMEAITRINEKHPSAEEQVRQVKDARDSGRDFFQISRDNFLLSLVSKSHDNLQIQSGIDLKSKHVNMSKGKQFVMTSILMLAGLVVVYTLMHPLSRV